MIRLRSTGGEVACFHGYEGGPGPQVPEHSLNVEERARSPEESISIESGGEGVSTVLGW